MLKFKPEARKTWESSKENIIKYINGEIEDVIIDESIARVSRYCEAKAWIQGAIDQIVHILLLTLRLLPCTRVTDIY